MIIVRHSWNIRNTLCIISIGVLSFLIYIGSLGNGFVYDDHFLIENNPWIKDVTHIIDAFTSVYCDPFVKTFLMPKRCRDNSVKKTASPYALQSFFLAQSIPDYTP